MTIVQGQGTSALFACRVKLRPSQVEWLSESAAAQPFEPLLPINDPMAMRNPQRDGSGRMDRFADRRKRYMAVLRTLGLEELFAAMSRPVQDGFLHTKFPDPVLEFDDTFPTDRAHRDLRKQ